MLSSSMTFKGQISRSITGRAQFMMTTVLRREFLPPSRAPKLSISDPFNIFDHPLLGLTYRHRLVEEIVVIYIHNSRNVILEYELLR